MSDATRTTVVRPGPGSWQLDASHYSAPITHFQRAILERGFAEGQARWLAAYGIPLRTIAGRCVDGFFYIQPQPLVGSPAAKAPPNWVFKLVVRWVPLFRRLRRRARAALDQKQWRLDAAHWRDEVCPALATRMRALQAEPISEASDAELADHVQRVAALALDAQLEHFATNGATMFPLGLLLRHVSQHVPLFNAAQVFAAVGGSDTARVESDTALQQLVAALGDSPLPSAESPAAVVQTLRDRQDDVGAATRAWLDVVEWRQVIAGDLDHPVGAEVPHLLLDQLDQLRQRLRVDQTKPESRSAGSPDEVAAAIRAALPHEARERFDELLEEARATAWIRDDRCARSDAWAGGLCRRALLEVGRRLVARHEMDTPELAVHLTCDEIVAALTEGTSPGADVVRARARHHASDIDEMPAFLGGPPAPPPPADLIPGALGQLMAGLIFYIDLMEGDLGENPNVDGGTDTVSGAAASPGCHVGTARVIHSPAEFGRVQPGDVLVARATMPSYNGPLAVAGAVVTDRGGALSHAAIVARELGIPAVVGTYDATTAIPDGATVRVDGSAGTVQIVAPAVRFHDDAPRRSTPASASAVILADDARVPPDPAGVPSIVPLRQAADATRFGGKATQLGDTLRRELPVPTGFALSAAFVEAVALGRDDARARVEALWSRELDGARVAVRSSGVAEDSGHASFAGQHRTVLGVDDAAGLLDAIHQVWASARTEAALTYRARMGLDGVPRLAVVVQHMLDPDCAGVLFTRDPSTGADVRVIEAAWGLGESVVSGLVTPDRYVVERGGSVRSSTLGAKDMAIVAARNGGTQTISVDAERAARPCLDDARLAALEDLATRCESFSAGGLDIEWAFQGAVAHLVQSRPITRAAP